MPHVPACWSEENLEELFMVGLLYSVKVFFGMGLGLANLPRKARGLVGLCGHISHDQMSHQQSHLDQKSES